LKRAVDAVREAALQPSFDLAALQSLGATCFAAALQVLVMRDAAVLAAQIGVALLVLGQRFSCATAYLNASDPRKWTITYGCCNRGTPEPPAVGKVSASTKCQCAAKFVISPAGVAWQLEHTETCLGRVQRSLSTTLGSAPVLAVTTPVGMAADIMGAAVALRRCHDGAVPTRVLKKYVRDMYAEKGLVPPNDDAIRNLCDDVDRGVAGDTAV
jgi:hypothetical protein